MVSRDAFKHNNDEWKKKYMMNPVTNQHDNVINELKEMQEKENKLIKISGFDMDKLIELFSAGYYLKEPNAYERRINKW